MKLSQLALSATVSAIVVGIPAVSFASTSAIPAEQVLYAISCDDGLNSDVVSGTLFTVEESTAVMTKVGNGTETLDPHGCAGQGAFDPTDGIYYYLTWDIPGVNSGLATMDTETGLTTIVGTFTYNGNPAEVKSMAIDSSGNAFAVAYDGFYSIDLETGDLTQIRSHTFSYLYALAFDANDNLYGIYGGNNNELIEIDPADGQILSTNNDLADLDGIYSMAFDADGILWVEADYTLAAVDLGDPAGAIVHGEFEIDGEDYAYWTESIAIGPESSGSSSGSSNSLAETGPTNALSIVSVGATLVVIGAVAALGRRRQSLREFH